MDWKEFFERYGVTLAIVGTLALVVAILPGNVRDQVDEIGTAQRGGVPGTQEQFEDGVAFDGETGTGAAAGVAPQAPGADLAGEVIESGEGIGQAVFGEGDCRPDGREAAIGIYSPPCVRWEGNNGGATARGVFADKVVVARWLGQIDPATRAILQQYRLADPPDVVKRSYDGYRRYFNHHTITYGREVVFVDVPASGPSEDDRAMRADAIRIAEDVKAFAVIEGNPQAPLPIVLARELAQRGVICVCTGSLTSDFYQENPPYIIGTGLPTSTEYAMHIGEFIGKRLGANPAEWAGELSGYRTQPRRYGLLYLEGARGRVEPEGKRYADQVRAQLARHGVGTCQSGNDGGCLASAQGFLYDPGRNQNEISTIISGFVNARVTTIIGMWDPLSPILITREATRQGWFPEWFISGTGLSDTTTAGRLYDPAQWSRAFGISPLWITWNDHRNSGAYRAFHHATPEANDGDEGVLHAIYAALVGPVFFGIHMAGPNLTPDTFSQGIFRMPPTGGLPAAPLVYWTREFPTAVKDMTEVWFDATRTGRDERGEDAAGMMIKVNNGQRYRPGEWPGSKPKAFVRDGTDATTSDDPRLSGDHPHDRDGHTHAGPCKSCPGGGRR